jgi:hypothetical protein
MHPEFRRFAPYLREWFGCRSLVLETNGHRITEYKDLLHIFDEVLISHYPHNKRETEFLAGAGLDNRPPGPTLHVTTTRRAVYPRACRRANFLLYVYGRLYPCGCIPAGHESIGVPLTSRWREEIQGLSLPCAECCFAEEAGTPAGKTGTPGAIASHPGTCRECDGESDESLRWPQRSPDIRIYGLDLDSWMGRKAEIRTSPQGHMDDRMVIHFESHAPKDSHPLNLTFAREDGTICKTYEVAQPGNALVELEIRKFFPEPGNTSIVIGCDKTFRADQTGSHDIPVRELGIRIKSLNFVSPRNREQEMLHAEHLRIMQQLTKELAAKEGHICAQQQEILAKNILIRDLRRTSLYFFFYEAPLKLGMRIWKRLKRMRGKADGE